jgi:hypothetical protein
VHGAYIPGGGRKRERMDLTFGEDTREIGGGRERKCVWRERLGFLKESCDRKSGKGKRGEQQRLKLARIDKFLCF